MKVPENQNIKRKFGEQLAKYRMVTGLSQREYAKYLDVSQKHVTNAEIGAHSVNFESIGKFADSFGVKYFNMADPDYAIPPFEQMPKAIRDYVAQQKQEKVLAKHAQTAKEEKLMKELLKSTFLQKPKTAEEIAAKLSSKIILKPSRVKALLREKGLKELVKVVPGEGTYVLRGFWKGE